MNPDKDLVIQSLNSQLANANLIMANQEAVIRQLQNEIEDKHEKELKEMDGPAE